ncbi:MAG: hypothetical protein HY907_03110 [Deltaproteobacteria bacterium]|nr:hypothetical protein [Deltaproteobacteria bacterium]
MLLRPAARRNLGGDAPRRMQHPLAIGHDRIMPHAAAAVRSRAPAHLLFALLAGLVGESCYEHTTLLGDDDQGVPDAGRDARDAVTPDATPPPGHWLVRIDGAPQLSAVRILDDGSIYAAGDFAGSEPAMWVVRLDGDGTILEQHRIDAVSLGNGTLVRAPGGGVRVAGTTTAWGAGLRDVWLAELSGGTIYGQHTFGGPRDESDPALLALPDGSLLLAARTDTRFDFADIVLASLAADGTVLHQRLVGTPWEEPTGRRMLLEGPGGRTYLVAGIGGAVAGFGDIWTLALDATGEILWRASVGGPGNDRALAALVDGDGLVLVSSAEDAGGCIGWMGRIAGGGALSWQRAWRTGTCGWLAGLASAPGGEWLLAGTVPAATSTTRLTDAWLARVDAAGAVHRQISLRAGGSTHTLAMAALGEDAVVVGFVTDEPDSGPTDAFVARVGLDATFRSPCDVREPAVEEVTSPDFEVQWPAYFERGSHLECREAAAAMTPTDFPGTVVCGP